MDINSNSHNAANRRSSLPATGAVARSHRVRCCPSICSTPSLRRPMASSTPSWHDGRHPRLRHPGTARQAALAAIASLTCWVDPNLAFDPSTSSPFSRRLMQSTSEMPSRTRYTSVEHIVHRPRRLEQSHRCGRHASQCRTHQGRRSSSALTSVRGSPVASRSQNPEDTFAPLDKYGRDLTEDARSRASSTP